MENNPNPNLQIDTKVETKSHLDKLAEVFLPEDLESMGNNIMNTIVVPTILKSAGDILVRSIDTIFGTNYSGIRAAQQTQGSAPYTAYAATTKQTTNVQQVQTMQIIPVRQGVYDYAVVKFRSIDDATRVLNNMRAIIQNTGRVSVGQYLDLANARTTPEDFNYGWTSLTTVSLQNTGDPNYPYRMLLPTPVAFATKTDNIYI